MKLFTHEPTIRRLTKSDGAIFQQQIQLFGEVFDEENPGATSAAYLETLLENPAFIAFAILQEQEVWGGATAYILPLYQQAKTEVFLYDIAIHPDYQRQGLGAKLLSSLIAHCRQEGLGEVFVATHEEDAGALDFYRATGGREEKVRHFTYF
jgi:aminoglycoside 3-N-acetyltransferase I